MAKEPADYSEWRDRRNSIAMSMCSALMRSKGETCGCYNGDERPDDVHFEKCRTIVEQATASLQVIGVPIPPKPEEKAAQTRPYRHPRTGQWVR